MDGKEPVIQQQFHLGHGLLELFRLKLAFPDDDHLPAVIDEELVVLLIPLLVSLDLVHPKLTVCLRDLTAP